VIDQSARTPTTRDLRARSAELRKKAAEIIKAANEVVKKSEELKQDTQELLHLLRSDKNQRKHRPKQDS